MVVVWFFFRYFANYLIQEKELFNLISSRVEKFESVKELFIGIFVDVLRSEILAKAKINENKSTKTLKNDEIFKLCSTIKHFEYNMIDFCYFNVPI